MNISVAAVREAIRKDDQPYINTLIAQYIAAAKASLLVTAGTSRAMTGYDVAPCGYEEEYDSLTDTYITEYCRGMMDQVDNQRTLDLLAVQIESIIKRGG